MRRTLVTALAVFALAGATAAATAQNGADRDIPQEDQNACQNDAFDLCGDAIPDHDKVYQCLKKNWGKVSAQCKSVMNKYPSKPPSNGASKSTAAGSPAHGDAKD